MTGELPLRIVVVGPPPGVPIQMQRGRFELLPPTRSTRDALTFDFTIRLGEPKAPDAPRESAARWHYACAREAGARAPGPRARGAHCGPRARWRTDVRVGPAAPG